MHRRQRPSLDMISVDRDSQLPMYRQIYEVLRSYILEERIAPRSLLPSTRSLAEQLKIGRNTVLAAYDQLLAEGFVEARPGLGTTVVAIRPELIATKRRTGLLANGSLSRRGNLLGSEFEPDRDTNAINVFPGVPDTSHFPFVVWSSILARTSRSRDETILNYLSFEGHVGLRDTIARNISLTRGVVCDASEVIIVTGTRGALDILARILLDDGDPVWLEEPGYLGARAALLGAGARISPLRVTLEGWKLTDPNLAKPKLIYVTPSCQWPYGTIMKIEERLQLDGHV